MFASMLCAAIASAAPADAPVAARQTAPSPPDSTAITHGQPATSSLPAIDLDSLPDACKTLGQLAGSPSPTVALSSRVSLANCLAEERMRPLSLVDCEMSVRDLNEAATPSLELLDDVIAAAEPSWRIVALHAKGELLSSMSVRMLMTVPRPPAGAGDEAIALRDMRVTMLQSLLQPWLDLAQDAFKQVDRLARAQPELAKNQVVRSAVLDSQNKLVPGVATR
ncbi:MAG: hypothetical protein JWO36_5053 [Myxococcales bacterium]|nr:hypothetical protein [Myxococcales bacterium]